MNIEPLSSLNEILPVLTGCNLPVADILAASPPQFFGIRVTGVLVAVVGLELFQSAGLLRSPAFRGRGLAQELVAFAEAFAAAHGALGLCVHHEWRLTGTQSSGPSSRTVSPQSWSAHMQKAPKGLFYSTTMSRQTLTSWQRA